MNLNKEVEKLRNSTIKKKIAQRLKQFNSFKKKNTKEWFSEMCFCILTANSKAETAINIQNELGVKGFCGCCVRDLSKTIRRNKHRFHNNKARYIAGARCNINIKEVITATTEREAREWLVKHVKGLGYKEASHFLRNVGYKNLAILDRHIISLLLESGKLKTKPKTLTKKNYLQIENKFNTFAKKLNMTPAELDMYMWYMKTGKVLK